MAGKTPGYEPLNHGKIFAYEDIDAQKGDPRDEMDEGWFIRGFSKRSGCSYICFSKSGNPVLWALQGAIEIKQFSPHPIDFLPPMVSGKK